MIKLIIFNAISVLVLVLIIGAITSLSIQWAALLSVIVTLVVDYFVIDYLIFSKFGYQPQSLKKLDKRWDGKR